MPCVEVLKVPMIHVCEQKIQEPCGSAVENFGRFVVDASAISDYIGFSEALRSEKTSIRAD